MRVIVTTYSFGTSHFHGRAGDFYSESEPQDISWANAGRAGLAAIPIIDCELDDRSILVSPSSILILIWSWYNVTTRTTPSKEAIRETVSKEHNSSAEK